MNIVQLIMNQLSTSGATEQLARTIGIDPEQVRTASGAAIPTLLAGLTHIASTPDGARKLDAAVDAAGESSASGMQGTSDNSGFLQSLFGGSTLSALSGALGKFTGLGSGSIVSLLGGLAPMVLGFLKNQKQSLGLDATGLAALLGSQKSNIAAAMPSGLSSALGGIPGLSSVTGAGRSVTSAAGDVYDRGREAAGDAYDRGRQAAGSAYNRGREAVADAAHAAGERTGVATWMWALPLIALVGLIAWLMSRPATPPAPTAYNAPARVTPPPVMPPAPAPVAEAPAPAATPAAPQSSPTDLAAEARTAAETLAPSSTDVTTQFTDATKKLTDTLAKVTDPASADAALPMLTDQSKKLDSISGMTSALPADTKTQLMSAVGTSRTAFKAASDKALAIPGVSDKLKPTLDAINKKLDTIAGS